MTDRPESTHVPAYKRPLSASPEAGPSRLVYNPPSTVSEPNHVTTGQLQVSAAYKPKRKRITPVQLETLAAAFAVSDTPLYDVRENLAEHLGMTNREVQVWFQNRRAKMARLRARANASEEGPASDSQPESCPPILSQAPYSSIQQPSSAITSSSNSAESLVAQRPVISISTASCDEEQPYRDTDSAYLPLSSSGSAYSGNSLPFAHRDEVQDLSGSTSSRSSATASWLSSLSSSDQYHYGPPSPNTTLSSNEFSPSPSEHGYLSARSVPNSVRSAPTRIGDPASPAPGNFFLGPAPVLPSPATDFLNLSLQQTGKPQLPLPTIPTNLTAPVPISHAPQPPPPGRKQRSSHASDPSPSSARLPNVRSWYSAWPDTHMIPAPPNWSTRAEREEELGMEKVSEEARRPF